MLLCYVMLCYGIPISLSNGGIIIREVVIIKVLTSPLLLSSSFQKVQSRIIHGL
jgi:hypothetical protein